MGRECLDLICLALSALVLSSDYLIHTVDTDYLGRATIFMGEKEKEGKRKRREGKGGRRDGRWSTPTWVKAGGQEKGTEWGM